MTLKHLPRSRIKKKTVPEGIESEAAPEFLACKKALTVAKEYESPAERASMHTFLTEKSRKATRGLILVGVVELFVIILNLIPSIADKLAIETEAFIAGSPFMCVINAILIIAAAALNNVRFVDGFTGIFKKNITVDSAVSLSLAIALVQNVLAAFIGGG